MTNILVRLFIVFMWVLTPFVSYAEDKLIEVPSEIMIEMVLADESGFLDGSYDLRFRLFDESTYERLWYEDIYAVDIEEGAFVVTLNSDESLDASYFSGDDVILVLTVNDDLYSVEIPLLTDFFSYRSVYSEYGYATRYPDVFYVDRDKGYIGIGTSSPDNYLDINGAIKIGYEDTSVTGSIVWTGETLSFLRDDGWMDLLYNPSEFETSQFTEYQDSIQMSSEDVRIGIGLEPTSYQLEVDGDTYVLGVLRADNIQMNDFYINEASFLDGELNATQVKLSDSTQVMLWNSQNVIINYGVISGDGSGLTDVGALSIDFPDDIVSSGTIEEDTLTSENLSLDVISGNVLSLYTILIDKFELDIFVTNNLAVDSIGSDNIIAYSLPYSVLEDSIEVSEYIPDGYFESSMFSDDSIYLYHFQDQSISSVNFSGAIFTTEYFDDDVIISDDISSQAVTESKIGDGVVTFDLFNTVATISDGGTGLTEVVTGQVVVVGDNEFELDYVLSFDDETSFVGIDQVSPDARFVVNHSTGSAEVIFEDRDPLRSVELLISNSEDDLLISVGNDGFMTFDLGDGVISLSTFNVFGEAPETGSELYNLGSAITIGDSQNSEPIAGTMEYNSYGNFRFYDGTDWVIVSDYWNGLGIGSAIAVGDNHLNLDNSFLGQVEDSEITLQDSMLIQSIQSDVKGSQLSLGFVEQSTIQAQGLVLSSAYSSQLNGQNLVANYIEGSSITGDSLYIDIGKDLAVLGHASMIQYGDSSALNLNEASAKFIYDSSVTLNTSVVEGIYSSSVDANQSQLIAIQDTSLIGEFNYVSDLESSIVYGDNFNIWSMFGSSIEGSNGGVMDVSNSIITGDSNYLFDSDQVILSGNNNRVIGSHHNISGNNNIVFGSHALVDADDSIVFYSGVDEPNIVHSDHQVVFSAPNGIRVITGPDMIVAATESSGGWTMVSDRNLKTEFKKVDSEYVFNQLMQLPIQKWEYTFNEDIQHMGPMAQDFSHAFQVGEDPRFITSSDSDGVAFSALQYLIQHLDQFSDKKLDYLDTDIVEIDSLLDSLLMSMTFLDTSIQMKIDSMKYLMENNLEQYQMMDKQFKVFSRFNNIPSVFQLMIKGGKFCVIFFISVIMGFYGLKIYYKYRGIKGVGK